MPGTILIGTSGYSYDDWKGRFYPAEIPKREMLDFYSRQFNTVEVNSTYYRIPHPSVMQKMEARTPAGFEFTVKLNQEMTHRYSGDKGVFQKFRDSVQPLRDAGKLGCLLAQFPYSFSRKKENREYIKRVGEEFSGYVLIVEFRNSSWMTEEVFNFLKQEGIGFCCVDEPRLPGLMPGVARCTSSVAYVRFHSRDAGKWYAGAKQRYDYLYSREELLEWTGKIAGLAREAKKVYVFFNNCHAGHAATNARMMQELL